MAWTPRKNALVTIENFDSFNLSGHTGFQSAQDGSVRLVPQYTGRSKSYYANWPSSPGWNRSYDFNYSGQVSGEWISATGTGGINQFIQEEGSWVISSPVNQPSYISLSGDTLAGFSGNFALEMALSVDATGISQSGFTGIHNLGLYIREYDKHEYIEFHQSGVHFHYHPELDFALDLRTRKNLRVGVSGSDLYFFAQPGFAMYAPGKWNRSSETIGNSQVIIGSPVGSDVSGNLSGFSGTIQLDSFRTSNRFFDLDSGFLGSASYVTASQVAYTDIYDPGFAVGKFLSLDIFNEIVPGASETVLTPQTRHGNNGSWINHSPTTLSNSISQQSINLTDIPVFSDGNDQFRVKIVQSSVDGITQPTPVDKIVLYMSKVNRGLNISPNWGSTTGTNVVSLTIDLDNLQPFPNPNIDDPDMFFGLSSIAYSGQRWLFEQGSGVSGDVIGHVTGNGTNVYQFGQITGEMMGGSLTGLFINPGFDLPYIPAGQLNIDPGHIASGNPSGIAFGVQGQIASGDYSVYSGNSTNVNDIYFYQDISRTNQYGDTDRAQGVRTQATGVGLSVKITGLIPDRAYRFKIDVGIEEGGDLLLRNDSSGQWIIDTENYDQIREFACKFSPTGSTSYMHITSQVPEQTTFILDNVDVKFFDPGHIEFQSGAYHEHTQLGPYGRVREYQNLYVDAKLRLYAAPEDYAHIINATPAYDGPISPVSGFFLRINPNREIEFGLGYCYSTGSMIDGSRDIITGANRVPLNEDIHIAAGLHSSIVSGYIEGARIYTTYNGQVVASKEMRSIEQLKKDSTGLWPVLDAYPDRLDVGSGAYMELDWVTANLVKSADPEYMGQKHAGFGRPYFGLDRWHVPESGNAIVLRGANDDGALVSQCPERIPGVVTNPNGWITFRDVGTYGLVNNFNSQFKGGVSFALSDQMRSHFENTNSGSHAFATWLTWGGESGTLWSVVKEKDLTFDNSNQAGLKMDINPAGEFVVYVNDFGISSAFNITTIASNEGWLVDSNTPVSGTQIVPGRHTHIGYVNQKVDDSTYKITLAIDGVTYINNQYVTGSYNWHSPLSGCYNKGDEWNFSLASVAGTGNHLDVSIEETIFSFDDKVYGTWSGFSGIADPFLTKSQPTDRVFVGLSGLSGSKVVDFSLTSKFVVMPSGNGDTIVWSTSNDYLYGGRSGDRGWQLFSDSAYSYISTYNYRLDETPLRQVFGDTRSPFRMGTKVPAEAINLSYISQPDFSVENSVSLIDLSYKTIENISNYLFGDFVARPTTTGVADNVEYKYNNQIDTKDSIFSSASAIWEGGKVPSPLYYDYLIGRGVYAVVSPEDNVDAVRKSIRLIDENGKDISQEEFPWDIAATGVGPDGVSLPSGHYGTVLMTRYPFLKNRTVWVQYTAAPFVGSDIEYGYRETIFPEPILTVDEDYSLEYQSGRWDLTISVNSPDIQ